MSFSFSFSRIPSIMIGPEKWKELLPIIHGYGTKALFITYPQSPQQPSKIDQIIALCNENHLQVQMRSVNGEPSPDLIDTMAAEMRSFHPDVVIAIGGGSVMDTGKAVAAMIPQSDSVRNYLEGVGTKKHNGKKIPMIAMPTTSGTGSEATKNAVLSSIGTSGFKKSIRHDNFIPDVAILDPTLMVTCPANTTAACGLDAFTQLLEAFTSSKANTLTDTLARSGMIAIRDNLEPAVGSGAKDLQVRAAMAYGALMSGITLANAGLGIVHGLASPIGGYFNIPHGVVCGTLLGEATRVNVMTLRKQNEKNKPQLRKYAEVGAILVDEAVIDDIETDYYCNILIEELDRWIMKLQIPRLSNFGITNSDLDKIIVGSELKNNPIMLTPLEIRQILLNRL